MGDRDRNGFSFSHDNRSANYNASYSRTFNDGSTRVTATYDKTEGQRPRYEGRIEHKFNEDTRGYVGAGGQFGHKPDRYEFGVKKYW